MLKNILTPILLLLLTCSLSAQEDFEGGGPGITWTAFDGTHDGIVTNRHQHERKCRLVHQK
jgi:hypothetical protein